MKILLLADPLSSHTQKWANSLYKKGIDLKIFGLSDSINERFAEGIKIRNLNIDRSIASQKDGRFSKVRYLKALPVVKKIIKEFKPDILHAHYLSSYGLIGALTNFHPFLVSVWGSDIYEFPSKNILFKKIVNFNLSRADRILSTSINMAREIEKYNAGKVDVIPFGIDCSIRIEQNRKSIFKDSDIVIGTVKLLEKLYGIDILIKSFSFLKQKYKQLSLKLLIVGGGSQEKYLKSLVNELGIQNDTVFTGMVPHDQVFRYFCEIDIPVFLSYQESFGVSVLEAGYCCKPVVVSEIAGFKEIISEGETGLFTPAGDPAAAAERIERLILEPELYKRLGRNGRQQIIDKYDWSKNVEQMISIYKNVTGSK